MPLSTRVKMYNPGLKIDFTIPYTLEQGHDPHCVATWMFTAQEKDFFFVPTGFMVAGAPMELGLKLVDTILRTYGDRGVIYIDPNWKPDEADEQAKLQSIARDDAEAVAKGSSKWRVYYTDVARKHIEQCQNCRAANMPPIPASGFTRRALELAGLIDPANALMEAQKGRVDDIDNIKEALRKQQETIEKQNALINSLLAAREQAPQPVSPRKKATN